MNSRRKAPSRSPAKLRKPGVGSIASAIAKSAEGLPGAQLRPLPRTPDLDTVVKLISDPAWSNIGVHVRMAYAMLTAGSRGIDHGKLTIELLNGDNADSYIDVLAHIGQTRIALYQIAEMLKLSVQTQWSAVNAALIAGGHKPLTADDEICDDNDLLALRPAFEAGRAEFKAATEAVAKVGQKYAEDHPRAAGAYEAQTRAIDTDEAVLKQVAATPARTKEGIQFKREVRAYWDDCEQPELDASIFADLLAYVEASP